MPENRTQHTHKFAKKASHRRRSKQYQNQIKKFKLSSTTTQSRYQHHRKKVSTVNNNRHRRSKTSEFSSHSNLKLCNSIFCEEDRRSRANMLFFLHETYTTQKIKEITGTFLDQCGMIHFSPSQTNRAFF